MSYPEAKEQFDPRVLETDEYYNGIINVRVRGSKSSKEHLGKLSKHIRLAGLFVIPRERASP